MNLHLPRWLLTAPLLLASAAALADGDCDRRPLNAAEKSWLDHQTEQLRGAVPAARGGWIAFQPKEFGVTDEGTEPLRRLEQPCKTVQNPPYWAQAAAFFTPADSALAERLKLLRARAGAQRQQERIEQRSQRTGAEAYAGSGDVMALQQEIMAAQARGDMAAMQAAMEKMQRAQEQLMQGHEQNLAGVEQTYEGMSRLALEEQQREQALIANEPAAEAAPRVAVTVALNPPYLPARSRAARSLSIAGAKQAWIEDSVEYCPMGGSGAKGMAVALFGDLEQDWDDGAAVSYRVRGGRGTGTVREVRMATACGDPAQVEGFLRQVKLDALR